MLTLYEKTVQWLLYRKWCINCKLGGLFPNPVSTSAEIPLSKSHNSGLGGPNVVSVRFVRWSWNCHVSAYVDHIAAGWKLHSDQLGHYELFIGGFSHQNTTSNNKYPSRSRNQQVAAGQESTPPHLLTSASSGSPPFTRHKRAREPPVSSSYRFYEHFLIRVQLDFKLWSPCVDSRRRGQRSTAWWATKHFCNVKALYSKRRYRALNPTFTNVIYTELTQLTYMRSVIHTGCNLECLRIKRQTSLSRETRSLQHQSSCAYKKCTKAAQRSLAERRHTQVIYGTTRHSCN